jgi:ribonuclease HI
VAEALSSLEAIITAIGQLTPAERRELQRYLRVSGLLLPETAITDQARLSVAPALGTQQGAMRPVPPPAPSAHKPVFPEARTTTPSLTQPIPTNPPANNKPISGKVVVYDPAKPTADAPHAMQPLPGQAPEQPIQIVFDGGSKGNPGLGYGSYALHWPGTPPQIVRLRFGNHVTNNEAEYDTLIAALEAVLKRLRDQGADPTTAKLEIRGDSLLVINQVQNKWQCKEPALRRRRDQVQALLAQLGRATLTHHGRANSVEMLGH